MGWSFLGGFLAVLVVLAAAGLIFRRRIRRFSRRIFGRPDLLGALAEMETEAEASPRSVNGMDALLLPKVLADFPDFDLSQAKEQARSYIRERLAGKEGLVIHNVVLARYLPAAVEKTLVFQAAVAFREEGRTVQKRYDLSYAYRLPGGTTAANCPNCGGALGFGVAVCPYCGSRVANPLGAVWRYTEMVES